MGGNGASFFQSLVCLGAGAKAYGGWIAIADHDVIEESNLNRIPYAYHNHVNLKKVKVAREYAQLKNKDLEVIALPCKITEDICEYRARSSTILIGAGDNDGVRKILNNWSVKYGIPYIDLGCEIIVKNDKFDAGGQVRVVIPDENACLVCCGGYDSSQAAIDLMDEKQQSIRASAGYLRGANIEAAPSIVNLNGAISDIGIAAFLSVVHGDKYGSWDYAYYNQLAGTVITAKTSQNPNCPLCISK